MKVAAFQFEGSDDIEKNLLAIEQGIIKAAEQNVRFMITQECALCGYPPIETEKVANINFHQTKKATEQISQLAIKHQMYIGLGTIIPDEDQNSYTNSVILISPNEENFPVYHKRALWGWDRENFTRGNEKGVFTIDNVKLGLRICFEIRFPEYFRELFRENVEIVFVSFCDVAKEPNPKRYELIKSHLITRAVENAVYLISVNSTWGYQTAPTCLIDPDGDVLESAPQDQEYLLTLKYELPQSNFGRDGRIHHSKELLGM